MGGCICVKSNAQNEEKQTFLINDNLSLDKSNNVTILPFTKNENNDEMINNNTDKDKNINENDEKIRNHLFYVVPSVSISPHFNNEHDAINTNHTENEYRPVSLMNYGDPLTKEHVEQPEHNQKDENSMLKTEFIDHNHNEQNNKYSLNYDEPNNSDLNNDENMQQKNETLHKNKKNKHRRTSDGAIPFSMQLSKNNTESKNTNTGKKRRSSLVHPNDVLTPEEYEAKRRAIEEQLRAFQLPNSYIDHDEDNNINPGDTETTNVDSFDEMTKHTAMNKRSTNVNVDQDHQNYQIKESFLSVPSNDIENRETASNKSDLSTDDDFDDNVSKNNDTFHPKSSNDKKRNLFRIESKYKWSDDNLHQMENEMRQSLQAMQNQQNYHSNDFNNGAKNNDGSYLKVSNPKARNLFRIESKYNWTENKIEEQEHEMQEQLELLKHQSIDNKYTNHDDENETRSQNENVAHTMENDNRNEYGRDNECDNTKNENSDNSEVQNE